jgi:aerobic-type carbon monoxide dehydrogenase small subunit (CoxS/CutS family)
MTRHRIEEKQSIVTIELVDVAGRQDQLMQAFGECQAGQCSCPTNEYEKLASMEVEQDEDAIRVRLEPKPGESLDTSAIAACLDSTTAD